ncbi:hypothetical protein GXM_06987 [Nostoc sphaeroides CCNUC1]|uniref:Uncharacterized protein n=1 Tax=Nostoc sphaeroides CCNUC1 TaxID=2653204 RepID=A0A5P8W9N1_9NOSO|nr:hypothetical protein GXM_06987 [Nostoc sphaeroides CCNUC1]
MWNNLFFGVPPVINLIENLTQKLSWTFPIYKFGFYPLIKILGFGQNWKAMK